MKTSALCCDAAAASPDRAAKVILVRNLMFENSRMVAAAGDKCPLDEDCPSDVCKVAGGDTMDWVEVGVGWT